MGVLKGNGKFRDEAIHFFVGPPFTSSLAVKY